MTMTEDRTLTRRTLIAAGATATAALCGRWPVVLAQSSHEPSQLSHLQELNALIDGAKNAGVTLPPTRRSASPEAQDYVDLMPRVVDLIQRAANGSPGGEDLAEKAAELLSRINRAERGEQPIESATRKAPPSLRDLEQDYIDNFQSCLIAPPRQTKVDANATLLTTFQPRYEKVSAMLGIPWYFIGIIHALEASFNFRGHLHNGDYPLTERTRSVPAGRPKLWNPPADWESSAVDALVMKGYDKEKDWGVPQLLYRWERYNGFGYHWHKVPTPYLWSFSNHYSRGKYVSDGRWDPNYVSQQCGAVPMLKSLVAAGKVQLS